MKCRNLEMFSLYLKCKRSSIMHSICSARPDRKRLASRWQCIRRLNAVEHRQLFHYSVTTVVLLEAFFACSSARHANLSNTRLANFVQLWSSVLCVGRREPILGRWRFRTRHWSLWSTGMWQSTHVTWLTIVLWCYHWRYRQFVRGTYCASSPPSVGLCDS